MFQVVYDYQKSWPENEPLRIEGHFVHEIAISPVVARRKANSFLAGYVTIYDNDLRAISSISRWVFLL